MVSLVCWTLNFSTIFCTADVDIVEDVELESAFLLFFFLDAVIDHKVIINENSQTKTST